MTRCGSSTMPLAEATAEVALIRRFTAAFTTVVAATADFVLMACDCCDNRLVQGVPEFSKSKLTPSRRDCPTTLSEKYRR